MQHLQDWVPAWARGAVFYHIYPLGFLGAPPHNDRQADPAPRLVEMRRWFDHLAGLGISAVYFGPLFESHSHGYDTIDYFRVDRRLGDNSLLAAIVGELHERGIRVILDGVFNHTGRDFFAFRDIRERGRDSAYHDWYRINWGADSPYGDGFDYESWEGHRSLPRLNHASPDVRAYLFEVARMWLADVGVDGWRLDVAYELPHDFIWELRRVCKQARPDAFLLGEVIHGDYRTWVAPDLLDSGTNYQMYTALIRSLDEGNLADLRASVERAFHSQWGVYRDLALYSFIGNHDVSRIASLLSDPRHVYTALLLLLTLPGIPGLYYGDEIGLEGRKEEGDAALRQPMPSPADGWPPGADDLLRETARLIGLRGAHPALAYGRCAALHGEGTLFAFLRQHVRESVVVAVNSGDEPASLTLSLREEGIPDGTAFRDLLDPGQPAGIARDGLLHVDPVWPGWGRVLAAG